MKSVVDRQLTAFHLQITLPPHLSHPFTIIHRHTFINLRSRPINPPSIPITHHKNRTSHNHTSPPSDTSTVMPVNWNPETELKLCVTILDSVDAKPDWAKITTAMNAAHGDGFTKESVRYVFAPVAQPPLASSTLNLPTQVSLHALHCATHSPPSQITTIPPSSHVLANTPLSFAVNVSPKSSRAPATE